MNAVKLSTVPESQIQVTGLKALKDQLGVTGTLKFLEQFDNGGSGDYTKEKYAKDDEILTKEEILSMFR